MSSFADRYEAVRRRIEAAARRGGRRAEDVTIIAVTKTVAPAQIEEAAAAGIRHIGENRVQEAREKKPQVQADLTWHLIGSLQRNKAAHALRLFDAIHSVDRLPLAQKLGDGARRAGRTVPCFVQVNVSGEGAKHGVSVAEAPSLIEQVRAVEGLKVIGLMTMAPFEDDPERVRPVFRRLRELAESVEKDGEKLALSMGMTNDFEVAVEEGATHVRVGRALFAEG